MIKLLRGDFARLFKSKTFWLGIIFMLVLAALMVHNVWDNAQLDIEYVIVSPDGILLVGAAYVGIVSAIFTGFYIGTDYSNGTVRNKNIMGHSRAAIYLSDLIVCVTASLIMHIAYIAVVIGAVCAGITPKFIASAGSIAAQILISVFSVAALSAMLQFVSMLIPHRSAGVVSAIVLMLIMNFAANSVHIKLREKEFSTIGYTIVTAEDGSVVTTPQTDRNPNYLTGTKRKVFEIIHNVLPLNQIYQMINGGRDTETSGNGAFLPLYSLALTAVITTTGVLIFRRKDLK